MTFYEHSQVPLTFTCLWGGKAFPEYHENLSRWKYLRFSQTSSSKNQRYLLIFFSSLQDKCIVYMASNCESGGASARTAYARELMQHLSLDSFGRCLHNKDLPKEMQFPVYSDHGSSMRNKIQIFK